MFHSKLNKFIHSSLSVAFLTITALSTAYCYGWGLAAFHGYPWWHVEVGNSNVARSLAYVLGSFLVIFFLYLMGYVLLKKVLQLRYFYSLGWLKVAILVAIFGIPVMVTFYLFLGSVPIYILLIYILATGICISLFQKRWEHRVFHLDVRKMFNQERFWFFNLFILVYFSLLALCIGYVKSEFRTTYDYMNLDGKDYYILSANMDNGYILGEKPKDNTEFLFFNRETLKYYRVYIKAISR